MADIEWAHAKCPVCGKDYPYAKGGYKPKTCSQHECVRKYLHPELSKGGGQC